MPARPRFRVDPASAPADVDGTVVLGAFRVTSDDSHILRAAGDLARFIWVATQPKTLPPLDADLGVEQTL